MKKLLLACLLLGVSLFVGCGGSAGSSTTTPPPAVTLVSITITPAAPSIAAGATQQFKATGSYSDGSTKDLTVSANWLSATSSVATTSTTGLATGVAAGSSAITASSAGITGTTTLTVTAIPLVSIAVTPPTASVAPNGTQQFTATGTYADGSTKNITATVTWSASTGAGINPAGLATGTTPGATSTITATLGSISGTATLTVTNPLVSIAVTPPTATVAPAGTQQFTATGTYADGSNKVLTSGVTWKASAGASITAGGLATGVSPGVTSTITATSGTISGTATLTVTNPLVSIAVTPPTASVAPNGTQQFTATGSYADGTTKVITSTVTWSASVGATITSGGLATGVTPNTTSTIMATQGTIAGTATLTITNPLVSIAVTAPLLSIAKGTTTPFTATGTYADGSTSAITSTVTWASSVPTVATISNSSGTNGLATGVAAGTTLITATSGTVVSPSVTLTVTAAILTSIAVTPVNPAIVYQTRQPFTAIGTFNDGTTQDITNTATWASGDTTKITITPHGAGGGVAIGVNTTTSPVTISATQSGITGSTNATVIPPTLVSIAITPSATNLAEGTSRQYTATGTQTNGSTTNVTNLATWTSSAPTIAGVGLHTGLVQAAASVSSPHNAVTISVSYSGVTQNVVLDVTNATVTSITVTPIAPTIPAGVTQRFSAVATFSDGSTQDVSSNATWTSDNHPVATVNVQGTASAVSSGVAHISAAFGGRSGTATLTVSTATLSSITVTPTSNILAPGSTISYQAIGTYNDGTTQFLTGLATWSSSNNSVVTVVGGGVATGQSAGTATITAKYQGVTSSSGGSVIVTASPLASIAIAPSTATVPEGVTTVFTATGTFQDGSKQNLTTNVTWASSQSAVATIGNAPGQQGFAVGVAPGTTSITAVFAGIVGTATLNVTNATVVSVAVTPANQNVAAGSQLSYTATGTFSDTSVVDLTAQVTWSSSVATVATINPLGLANTASPGVTSISAAFTQNGTTVMGMTNLTVH